MKINGTITTNSGKFSQIRKHVSRNWKHDKNEKSVNKNLSKFNLHDNYEKTNAYKFKLLKEHYYKYLKARNLHFKKQGHLNRCQSMKQYLSKHTPSAIGIATFGTMDDKHNLLTEIDNAYYKRSRKENHTRYYKASSRGLVHYVKGFNKRNNYIKITYYWTNVDEMGAPHVHFEMIPLGYTKLNKYGHPTKSHLAKYKSGKRKGKLHRVSGSKPSGDLTKAVEMEMGTNNNRLAFKKWNEQETKAIVKAVGSTYKQRFTHLDKNYQLHHTGRKGSLSMKSLKASYQKLDNENNYLNKKRAYIKRQEKSYEPLATQYHTYQIKLPNLKHDNQELTKRNSEIKKENRQQAIRLSNIKRQRQQEQISVNKLSHKKKNLKDYLKSKWNAFKVKHFPRLYKGIAKGLKAVFPEWEKPLKNINRTYLDLATNHARYRHNGHNLHGVGLLMYGIHKQVKKLIHPNKYAYDAMRDYINSHDSAYSADRKLRHKETGKPYLNAYDMNNYDVMQTFNYDTETVHNQRERNLGRGGKQLQ